MHWDGAVELGAMCLLSCLCGPFMSRPTTICRAFLLEHVYVGCTCSEHEDEPREHEADESLQDERSH